MAGTVSAKDVGIESKQKGATEVAQKGDETCEVFN
jgi:hypothetical protein